MNVELLRQLPRMLPRLLEMTGLFAGASAQEVIDALGLLPLEHEGAFWAPGPRTKNLNSIHALITNAADGFSALHLLTVDEGWEWLGGAPASMLRLNQDGTGSETILDSSNTKLIVEVDVWQGTSTLGDWTLVSCWCSPAFEWENFTLGDRDELTAKYTEFSDRIKELTRIV
jgi:predicted cupin superfamily sugar epimerase